MTIKFDVKMTRNVMFDFMVHTAYTSLNGILGVVFGGVVLVLGIQKTIEGAYNMAAAFFLFAGIFLVGNPINMWTRSKVQVEKSPMFQKPITYELTEEGVKVSQDDQSIVNEWKEFRCAVSTRKSVILYVTKVRALIFPREALGEQYTAAVEMIHTHMPPKKVRIHSI